MSTAPCLQAAAARKRYRDEYASGDETEEEAEAAGGGGYEDGEGEPCPNCGRIYRRAALHAQTPPFVPLQCVAPQRGRACMPVNLWRSGCQTGWWLPTPLAQSMHMSMGACSLRCS